MITLPIAAALAASILGTSFLSGIFGMAGGMMSTLRYIGGVAGTTTLGALLLDPASPASHQAPLFVYGGALVGAAVLSMALPGRSVRRGGP